MGRLIRGGGGLKSLVRCGGGGDDDALVTYNRSVSLHGGSAGAGCVPARVPCGFPPVLEAGGYPTVLGAVGSGSGGPPRPKVPEICC